MTKKRNIKSEEKHHFPIFPYREFPIMLENINIDQVKNFCLTCATDVPLVVVASLIPEAINWRTLLNSSTLKTTRSWSGLVLASVILGFLAAWMGSWCLSLEVSDTEGRVMLAMAAGSTNDLLLLTP